MLNKTILSIEANKRPRWILVDASHESVGRLAAKVSQVLIGKHKPIYSPTHQNDFGDHVVIVNAEQVKFTGKKWTQKYYRWHTGYPSGLKKVSAKNMWFRSPERIIEKAIKGMLPKSRTRWKSLSRVHIFAAGLPTTSSPNLSATPESHPPAPFHRFLTTRPPPSGLQIKTWLFEYQRKYLRWLIETQQQPKLFDTVKLFRDVITGDVIPYVESSTQDAYSEEKKSPNKMSLLTRPQLKSEFQKASEFWDDILDQAEKYKFEKLTMETSHKWYHELNPQKKPTPEVPDLPRPASASPVVHMPERKQQIIQKVENIRKNVSSLKEIRSSQEEERKKKISERQEKLREMSKSRVMDGSDSFSIIMNRFHSDKQE